MRLCWGVFIFVHFEKLCYNMDINILVYNLTLSLSLAGSKDK